MVLRACVALTLGVCVALVLTLKDLPQVLSGSPGVATLGSSNVLSPLDPAVLALFVVETQRKLTSALTSTTV